MNSRRVVLALDQGTTGSAALVFDADGVLLASADREIAQSYPEPGWVEHDPEEIFATTVAVGREALSAARLEATDVAAIGITNQRETTVVWERATGKPIYPAVVWQSRCSADICERLKADGLEPLCAERTGLVIDAYFSGTKVRWLLDRVPGAQRSAEAGELLFGTIDSWLVWKLTGGRVHCTDVSNASRTLLFNIDRLDWDDELLGVLSPDNGGVFLVPAFVGLGAPHWDMYARGLIIGLTRGTGRAHIARATLGQRWRSARRFEPGMSADQRDSLHHQWLRAVDRARGWAPSAKII